MNAAFPALDQQALKRVDDRRLSIAIGASLVIHALTIATLRGLMPAINISSQPGVGGGVTTLQAVIAAPSLEPIALQEPLPRLQIDPNLLLPPALRPIELLDRRPLSQTESAGSVTYRSGSDRRQVSIAVGTIDDPARIGPDYVARLAQRFPHRAAKRPALLGSPIVTYPAGALESGTERRVTILLTLRADGSIADSQLTYDDPLFGPAALEALKSAQFTPAEIDGKPIPYWAIVEFVFSLSQPSSAPSARSYARRGAAYPGYPSVGR
jgi:TonB family protein